MNKIFLTRAMTLAMRMTEIAIATHIATSLRTFERPIFQEIDFRTEELPKDGETLKRLVYLRVSFLNKGQLACMGCSCYMQNEIRSGDWQPTYAHIYNEAGTKLRDFSFDPAGNIIS